MIQRVVHRMAELSFQNLRFFDEKEHIRVLFLGSYVFYLDKQDVSRIGTFTINKQAIHFEKTTEKQAAGKFNMLLAQGFQAMQSIITGKKTIYVHRNSGIYINEESLPREEMYSILKKHVYAVNGKNL